MTAATTPSVPTWLPLNAAGLPPELREGRRFLVWRPEWRDDKWTKTPYKPADPARKAAATRPEEWGTLPQALAAVRAGRAEGVGVVLDGTDDLVAIDLDHVLDDAGQLAPWAAEAVRDLDSYTERSPSGHGLHVFVRGWLPFDGRRKGPVEVYRAKRYMTLTGQHVAGTPRTIEARPAALERFVARYVPDPPAAEPPRAPRAPLALDAEAILERMFAAKNGDKIRRLFAGDTSDYGGDDSRADLGLCTHLAFWTGRDPAAVDRLFRQSGLYREKWERDDYRTTTITKAVVGCRDVYEPPPARPPEPEAGSVTAPASGSALPTIVVNNRPLREVTTDALTAVEAANTPPAVYVRGGQLTRERVDERGRPLLEPMSPAATRGRIARVAECVKETTKGRVAVPPPKDLVEDLLALPSWPGLPPLEALVEIPTLRPDGTIIDRPGYDAATRLLYRPGSGLVVPPVPPVPARADLAEALTRLAEAAGEFPYVDAASRTNLLALLLTLVARPAIEGPVPLAVLDKPQAGTGASLLAEVSAILGTGRPAGMMTAPKDDAEWRKAITAMLLAGTTLVTIDNLETTLTSPSLAAAVTSLEWKDRVLGRSEMVRIPQRATWLVTGNNCRLGGDLPRRCYWIRLDAQTARPWLREGFRHPDLLAWVQGRRGQLLAALLTLCRAWWAAGCPAGDAKPLGGFEAWTRTIGGILAHAGCAGFLDNLAEMYERADDETPAWEAFLAAWRTTFGDRAVRVAEIGQALRAPDSALRAALPDDLADVADDLGRFQKRLGKALAKRAERRYGEAGLRIERAGDDSHGKVGLWRVRP